MYDMQVKSILKEETYIGHTIHYREANISLHISSGLVKCADCGRALSVSTHAHSVAPYRYFNCTTYRQYSKAVMRCTPHYIRYDVLYTYVLDRIRYWAKQAEIDEDALLQLYAP